MDPVSILKGVVGTAYGVRRLIQKIKFNKNACASLDALTNTIADIVVKSLGNTEQQDIPPALKSMAESLACTLNDLRKTLRSISDLPTFKQAIFCITGSIADEISDARMKLADAVITLQVAYSFNAFTGIPTKSKIPDVRKLAQQVDDASDREEATRTLEGMMKNAESIFEALSIPDEKRDNKEIASAAVQHLEILGAMSGTKILNKGARRLKRFSSLPPGSTPSPYYLSELDSITGLDKPKCRIHRSTSASVYKAFWNGVPVVIKEWATYPGSEAIEREIRTWKELKHANIVKFIACSKSEDGLPKFLICEIKEKGDVLTYLRKNPGADILKLLFETIQGIEYLHAKNIVHGNLKTSNILVGKDDVACIGGFGSSRILPRLAPTVLHSTAAQESVSGIAPETAQHGNLSRETDIYSFGTVIRKIMEKSVDSTDHELNPATRDRVSRLAIKCCSEKPEMRPSASKIITSLQCIRSISHTGGDPDKSLPPTPIEPEDSETDHIMSPQCTANAGDLPQEDQRQPMQLEDDKVYLPPDVPLFSPHPAPSYTQYYPNLPQPNGTVPIYPPCGAIWQEASPYASVDSSPHRPYAPSPLAGAPHPAPFEYHWQQYSPASGDYRRASTPKATPTPSRRQPYPIYRFPAAHNRSVSDGQIPPGFVAHPEFTPYGQPSHAPYYAYQAYNEPARPRSYSNPPSHYQPHGDFDSEPLYTYQEHSRSRSYSQPSSNYLPSRPN